MRGIPLAGLLLLGGLGKVADHDLPMLAPLVDEARLVVVPLVEMQQIVDETLPALRKEVEKGKVRYIGVSGYPMKMFKFILDQTDLDVVLSYNHYTLQNTMFGDLAPYLKQKGVGIMNAAPFSARLLTNAPLPPWHRATPEVRAVCRRAAEHCAARGVDIAQLALQFAVANRDITTTITGGADNRAEVGGSQTHTLTTAELAAHDHASDAGGSFWVSGGAFSFGSGAGSREASGIADAGSSSAHNNVQPTMVLAKIIKY